MDALHYTIPSDNWEQQHRVAYNLHNFDYTIPSDNWEQQHAFEDYIDLSDYTIPSDNWEQQPKEIIIPIIEIIPYQAITGNNNLIKPKLKGL